MRENVSAHPSSITPQKVSSDIIYLPTGTRLSAKSIPALLNSARSSNGLFKHRSENKRGATSELTEISWSPSTTSVLWLFACALDTFACSLSFIFRVCVRSISRIDRPQGIVHNLVGRFVIDKSIRRSFWLSCCIHLGLLCEVGCRN